MNFADFKEIVIPEGAVQAIGRDGVTLWEKSGTDVVITGDLIKWVDGTVSVVGSFTCKLKRTYDPDKINDFLYGEFGATGAYVHTVTFVSIIANGVDVTSSVLPTLNWCNLWCFADCEYETDWEVDAASKTVYLYLYQHPKTSAYYADFELETQEYGIFFSHTYS